MQNWNIAVTTFSKTPLLDTIRTPDDLRRLRVEQLRQVADELRQETIGAGSATVGVFAAVPTVSAPCAPAAVFPVSPSEPRATTIRSAPPTPRPRSRRASEWPWRAT